MRIQELEKRVQLDRATIRFYEKEKLIQPQRSENGYRSYSQEDAQDLLKIKLLRQLGMSMEQIRIIKQGNGDFKQALEKQISILDAQVVAKQLSAQVCRNIQKANVTYESLDADFYLAQLNPSPVQSPSGSAAKAFREPIRKTTHPVRRYVARALDWAFLSVAIRFILFVLIRIRPVPSGLIASVFNLSIFLLSMPINALYIHKWGTTPGKWIMGIQVLDFEGKKMRYADALFREWFVFGAGYGWYLPIYTIYRTYRSFMTYVQTGETDWDEGTDIHFSQWKGKGKGIFAAATVLIIVMSLWFATDAFLPTYRRDQLTVAQFARNYNFCLAQYVDDLDTGEMLNPDGSYAEEHSQFRYDYGISYEGPMPLTFETDNGYIRRVSGQFTGYLAFSGSFSWLTPCKTAAFTAVLSRSEATFQDVMELNRSWQEIPAAPEGKLMYNGVQISWHTEMVNCRCENGYYYILDETKPASITVDFEILYE